MEVEIFALCDAATDAAGKLNILGAFDTIASRQMPVVHPHCAIALRVRFDRIEQGTHRVRIDIVDSDGKRLVPTADVGFGVGFPHEARSGCGNLVLNIGGLKFEAPGQYSVDLAIDGRHEKSLPINVVLLREEGQQREAGNTQ